MKLPDRRSGYRRIPVIHWIQNSFAAYPLRPLQCAARCLSDRTLKFFFLHTIMQYQHCVVYFKSLDYGLCIVIFIIQIYFESVGLFCTVETVLLLTHDFFILKIYRMFYFLFAFNFLSHMHCTVPVSMIYIKYIQILFLTLCLHVCVSRSGSGQLDTSCVLNSILPKSLEKKSTVKL